MMLESMRSLEGAPTMAIEGTFAGSHLRAGAGPEKTRGGRGLMIDEMPEKRGRRAADLLKVGQLTVHSERDGALHTISVQGELDLANADDLERELIRVERTDAQS